MSAVLIDRLQAARCDANAHKLLQFRNPDAVLRVEDIHHRPDTQDRLDKAAATQLVFEDALKLRKGSVVPLDKGAGERLDIVAGGRLVARGEVVVLDNHFCVRVVELIGGEDVG